MTRPLNNGVRAAKDLADGARVVAKNFHAFGSDEVADDVGVEPWDWFELAGPVGAVVGPR